MSIPKLTKDLAVIQKLSDLPNSTEGLSAGQLKAKFDEAPLYIQSWINEQLIPALTALNIPFTPSTAIEADNVDAAIRAVQEQMTEVSSGTIANGSVTVEKLADSLLERVFGGRPWVSLDTPGSADRPETGFPIGQIWLRPAFTVTNAAGSQWTCSGCTVEAETNRLSFTGNGTVATATATQVISSLGQDGDRVLVLFSVENADSDLSALTVTLNGGKAQSTADGAWEGTLTGGSLTVKLSATWPSTSLANGSFDIVNYTVVNVDAILRQAAGAKDMDDWESFLQAHMPFLAYASPAEVLIQTGSGVWWPVSFTVQPVSRGGTGESSLTTGAILYGGGDRLEQLEPPEENGSFLQFVGGSPKWQTVEEAAESGSLLRVATGTYRGNGSNQTVTLPVTPKMLNISTPSGSMLNSSGSFTMVQDHPCTLGQGGKETLPYTVSSGDSVVTKHATVKLNGEQVSMSGPYFCNRSGVTYNWVAVY